MTHKIEVFCPSLEEWDLMRENFSKEDFNVVQEEYAVGICVHSFPRRYNPSGVVTPVTSGKKNMADPRKSHFARFRFLPSRAAKLQRHST